MRAVSEPRQETPLHRAEPTVCRDECWRGVRSLNIEPVGERKVERFGWTFAPSDKVMQIENDYDKKV